PERDEGDERSRRRGEQPVALDAASSEEDPDGEERDDLKGGLDGCEGIRQRAGKVLRAVRRDDRRLIGAQPVSGQENRRAEALDLERAAELLRQAVGDAPGRENGKREDHERKDRGKDREGERGGPRPPSPRDPDERDGQED